MKGSGRCHAGGASRAALWSTPGLKFDAGQGGAGLLRFDDAGGFGVDVEEVIGRAKAVLQLEFTQGDALCGVDVRRLEILHRPACRFEQDGRFRRVPSLRVCPPPLPQFADGKFYREDTPLEGKTQARPASQRKTIMISARHSCRLAGLIEVKLSEPSFGSCRGANNPECDHLKRVLDDTENKCWLARTEGRKYWQVLQAAPRGLNFSPIGDGACPWKGGLYQLMRNWAFGQALVQNGEAEDFHVGVCIHPMNVAAATLKQPVAGTATLPDAFNKLVSKGQVISVDPGRVIDALTPYVNKKWAEYVRTRYRLGDAN